MSDLWDQWDGSLWSVLRVVVCVVCLGGFAGWYCTTLVRWIHHFPPQLKTSPAVGPSGASVSETVVLVVVDGLTREATKHMKQLGALRRRGASLVARIEGLTYSRPAYSTLLTGAGMSLTGVTVNARDSIRPADSLFRQARRAGLGTGLVGYAWWMELFGPDVQRAYIDSAWKRNDAFFQTDRLQATGVSAPGLRRWVMKEGKYISVQGSWKAFMQRNGITDTFGNPANTAVDEDHVRVKQAISLLKKEQRQWIFSPAPMNLLVVHLQAPDAVGHDVGSPHSALYHSACASVDRAIGKLARTMDFRRQTLIVTSDHGFSRTQKGAGHGGWEQSVSLVPVVMAGAGIRRGWPAKGMPPARRDSVTWVQYVDLAPTIAVLLGLPFPGLTEGLPVWRALQLPEGLQHQRVQHWKLAQHRLYLARAQALGWVPPQALQRDPTKALSLRRWYYAQLASIRASSIAWRLFLGLFAWGFFGLLLCGSLSGIRRLPWLEAAFVWVGYELLFLGLFLWRLGPYSFSSVRGQMKGVMDIVLVSWGAMCLPVLALLLVWWVCGMGRWLLRVKAHVTTWALLLLGKCLLILGFLGVDMPVAMPHGLYLFGGMVFLLQTLSFTVVVVGWFVAWLVWRETGGEPREN